MKKMGVEIKMACEPSLKGKRQADYLDLLRLVGKVWLLK
jgi:hypothetical protein